MNEDKGEMKEFSCELGCCRYIIRPYPQQNLRPNSSSGNQGIRKAGGFIYDAEKMKVLLVQSRGQMWGPPKGSMNPQESTLDCAIREVWEETGLLLNESQLDRPIVIRSKAVFYSIEMNEVDVSLQTDQNDNDANGIGWFRIDCLQNLVESGKISINHPCRMLIRRVFGREIAFNLDSFVPVRRSSPSSSHH